MKQFRNGAERVIIPFKRTEQHLYLIRDSVYGRQNSAYKQMKLAMADREWRQREREKKRETERDMLMLVLSFQIGLLIGNDEAVDKAR